MHCTVVDIETTGFLNYDMDALGNPILSDTCEILSVGYIVIEDSRIDTELEDELQDPLNEILGSGVLYFYKPYFKVEATQHITGLTRDFLQQYEGDFEKNLAALETLITNTCIVGKNSDAFDIKVLQGFLNKHKGTVRTIQLPSLLGMKNYAGKRFVLEDTTTSIDVQKYFAPIYRNLYEDRYGIALGKQKKGSLSEYIDLLECKPVVDF